MLRLVLDEDKKITRTRMIERKELQQRRFNGFSKRLLFDDTAKTFDPITPGRISHASDLMLGEEVTPEERVIMDELEADFFSIQGKIKPRYKEETKSRIRRRALAKERVTSKSLFFKKRKTLNKIRDKVVNAYVRVSREKNRKTHFLSGRTFSFERKRTNIIVISGCLRTYSGISDPLELSQADLTYGDTNNGRELIDFNPQLLTPPVFLKLSEEGAKLFFLKKNKAILKPVIQEMKKEIKKYVNKWRVEEIFLE